MEITLEKDMFLPGEVITGTLSVITDKSFNTNAIEVSISGEAYAAFSEGMGDDEESYSERQIIFTHVIRLKEKGTISDGRTDFTFEYRLPEEIPGSYQGINGRITYQVTGRADISWRLDPRTRREFRVLQPIQRLTPYQRGGKITFDQENEVLAEVPSDILTPGQLVVVRYMVNGRPRMRGIRFDLVLRETVRPEREVETRSRVLSSGYVSIEDIPPETWMQAQAETNMAWPTTPQGDLIQAQYFAEVTVDIPYMPDKTVRIPLRIGKQ